MHKYLSAIGFKHIETKAQLNKLIEFTETSFQVEKTVKVKENVEISGGIALLDNGFIAEIFAFEFSTVEFAALDDQFGFSIGGSSDFIGTDGGQPRFGNFIRHISAGISAEKG